MLKTSACLLVFLALLVVAPLHVVHAQDKAKEIVIIYASDMRGKIDAMGKLAALAGELRQSHKHVFLVTDGNMFFGNPVVDMVKEKGFPMLDLMNHCGFSLSAIGNEDLDLGQKRLNARIKQAGFPLISCNIDSSPAVLKQPQPFSLLKADAVSIPVLGITPLDSQGLPEARRVNLRGLKFTPGVEKAQSFKGLKKKYGILIGLGQFKAGEAESLAEAMPEFDLILGGDAHTPATAPQIVNNVMIVRTECGLRDVGVITLTVQGKAVVNKTFQTVSLGSVKNADPNVQALVDKYVATDELNRAVGYTEAPLEGEHQLGSMITDAVANRLKLDFAFQNIGGIRISTLPAGRISPNDILRLDPSGNTVVLYRMNPAEIKTLICESFNREKLLELEVSGMTYTAVVDAGGSCSDAQMLDASGKPLDPGKDYTVGVNSYVAKNFKFDHRDPGQKTSLTVAQALVEYLGHVKKVNYSGVNRIGVKQAE